MNVFSWIEIGVLFFLISGMGLVIMWLAVFSREHDDLKYDVESHETFVEGWLRANEDRLNRLEAMMHRFSPNERLWPELHPTSWDDEEDCC